MDVIALTIFGFLLLGFVAYWKFRHRDKVKAFLESNQNVMPLFKEKSAQIKYDILQDTLKNDTDALLTLKTLHLDFADGRITIETYEAGLTLLQEQYNKH